MSCTGADVASSCNRYKATIICQEVAKAKNVCQVCLLDLEYGIPVQARDTALGIEDESLPESDVGKEFRLKEMENAGLLESSFSKASVPSAYSQNIFLCLSCLGAHTTSQTCTIPCIVQCCMQIACFGHQRVFTAALYSSSICARLDVQSGVHIGSHPVATCVLMVAVPAAGQAQRLTDEDAAHHPLLQAECAPHLLLLRQGGV